MTLWEMLDRTGYWQKVLIYERNNRGQNMPVFCGTVIEARRNGDTVWDYLPCKDMKRHRLRIERLIQEVEE